MSSNRVGTALSADWLRPSRSFVYIMTERATALADDVIMASADAVWLSLFSSAGSTLEVTGRFAQVSSLENWARMVS